MELVPMAEFTIVTRSSSSAWIPELIAAAGAQVTETYIDFFTSTIRNRNTRAAYARACWQFFDWCGTHGLELKTVRPFHVAAWIEDFPGSKPTIKQKLAAVRMLYDFLVVRQIHDRIQHIPFAVQSMSSKKAKRPSGAEKTPRRSWIRFQGLGIRLTGPGAYRRDVLQLRPCERSPELKVDDYYHNGARRRLRSTKKVARSTKCQCIICSSRSSTNTLRSRAFRTASHCFRALIRLERQ